LKFEVGLDIDAAAFINTQNIKTRRSIHTPLKSREDDPFFGKGGDRELLNTRPGVKIYRLHIGRSFTAIYVIEEHSVLVTEVMTIGQRRILMASSRPPGLKTSRTAKNPDGFFSSSWSEDQSDRHIRDTPCTNQLFFAGILYGPGTSVSHRGP
jgi:hypothetical protein